MNGYENAISIKGILKCSREQLTEIDPADYISARVNAFGAEVMVPDREAAACKYSGLLLDPAGIADAVSVIMEHGAVPAFMKWLLPVISIAVYVLSCLLSRKLYMKGADEYYH